MACSASFLKELRITSPEVCAHTFYERLFLLNTRYVMVVAACRFLLEEGICVQSQNSNVIFYNCVYIHVYTHA